MSIKLKSDQSDFNFYNESVDDFEALYFWKGNTRRTLWWPVIQEEQNKIRGNESHLRHFFERMDRTVLHHFSFESMSVKYLKEAKLTTQFHIENPVATVYVA